LLFIVSGASFISKKIKEQGFLRKSHQKKHTVPLGSGIQDMGSGKNSSRIRIPDLGGKKAPDPGSRIPDPQHWLGLSYFVRILITGAGIMV
jgi:hypothetical protein